VVIFKINIFVLKAGANPGFKDKAGRHSLHWAAHHGHVKCLKSLLNSKSAAAAATATSDQHPSNLTLMAERDNVIIRSTMLKNLTIFHISLMHIRPILF
jgi:ankyrin repeat protein